MAAQKHVVLVTTKGTLYWFDLVLSNSFFKPQWKNLLRPTFFFFFSYEAWSMRFILARVALNFFILVVFKALLLQYIRRQRLRHHYCEGQLSISCNNWYVIIVLFWKILQFVIMSCDVGNYLKLGGQVVMGGGTICPLWLRKD